MKSIQWWIVLLLGLSVMSLMALVAVGLYQAVPVGGGALYVVNKLTGSVSVCTGNYCRDLGPPPPAPPPAKPRALESYFIGAAGSQPAVQGYQVIGARKAGYSLAEIADYLAKQTTFDIDSARNDGVSDAAIISFLVFGKM